MTDTTHDPMCHVTWMPPNICAQCALIARVRADEREQAAKRVAAVVQGNQMLYTTAIRDAVAAARGKEV